MTELLSEVRALGWQRGWFEYAKQQVSSGHAIDDARAADWTFLVPANSASRVLLTGAHLRLTAAALAPRVREVWIGAADDVERQVLELWRTATGHANVRVLEANLFGEHAFDGERFDLVSAGATHRETGGPAVDFATLARRMHGLVAPGGTAHFVVDNGWSPVRLIARGGGSRVRPRSAQGYLRTLRRLAFSDVRLLAPLPRHTRTPMCNLPLDNRAAIGAFLRDLFPVFATVSPEVKEAHALEYRMAQMGVWLMTRAHLGGLLKYLVPGYCILARRDAR